METPATNFKEWMDTNQVPTKEVCKRFGISKQTLYNWRSSGIPESKQSHVNYIISCWKNPTAAELGSTLLIKPTAEQFRTWNIAALQNKQILEDWAIQGLDKYAEELEKGEEPEKINLSLVAEEPPPYRTNNGHTKK
jgi:hypothetical protein